jgi:hypothetical protein
VSTAYDNRIGALKEVIAVLWTENIDVLWVLSYGHGHIVGQHLDLEA